MFFILLNSSILQIISINSGSGERLTSSSYEEYITDQIRGDNAWNLVSTLSNATFEGRLTATVGQHLAAEFIASYFSDLGILPAGDLTRINGVTRSYYQEFTLSSSDGRGWSSGPTENVLGWVPGKNDEVVIISAHYDHL